MVKIALKVLSEQEFVNILNDQFNGLLHGGSLEDIDIFRVPRRHSLQGSGFLDIISSIGKFVLPAVKRLIVPAASEFAHGVIDDFAQGKSIKSSLKTRGKEGLKKIGSKILRGKGIVKKRGARKNVKRVNNSKKPRSNTKCRKGGSSKATRKRKFQIRRRRPAKKVSKIGFSQSKYHDIFS